MGMEQISTNEQQSKSPGLIPKPKSGDTVLKF